MTPSIRLLPGRGHPSPLASIQLVQIPDAVARRLHHYQPSGPPRSTTNPARTPVPHNPLRARTQPFQSAVPTWLEPQSAGEPRFGFASAPATAPAPVHTRAFHPTRTFA